MSGGLLPVMISVVPSAVSDGLLSITDITELTTLPALPSSLPHYTPLSTPLTTSPLSSSHTPSPSLLISSLTSHPSLPTPSPTPLLTSSTSLPPPPPLPSPPYHDTPAMEIDPIIYLIAGPLALGVLLGLLLSLICCIAVYFKLRKRKKRQSRRQSFKQRNSLSRIDQTKSLEAYGGNGCSPGHMEKVEVPYSKRYELHTLDDNIRASISSPLTENKALSLSRSGEHTAMSPQHTHTSSLPLQADHRLRDIPEHSIAVAGEGLSVGDKQAMMTSAGKAASLPYTSSGVLDPASLYDVPASSLTKEAGSLGQLGVYDVPKSALIAAGHYKVPPLSQSDYNGPISRDMPPQASGIYDVPPPASGIYDVPPPVSEIYDIPPPVSEIYDIPPPVSGVYDVPLGVPQPYQQGVDVFDVPPAVQSYPRQNSDPVLTDVRRSVVGSCGSDNVFTSAVPDYSHYDVPRHLLMTYLEEQSLSGPQTGCRLSRRNSNPSYPRNGMIYDTPREALLAQNNTTMTGPPTAPKPSKTTRLSRSRSQSTCSPREMASPEHRPHLNAAFYDMALLTAELLALQQREGRLQAAQNVDASNRSKSQHPTHASSRSPARVNKSSSRSPSRTQHDAARSPCSDRSPARSASSETMPARVRAGSTDRPPTGASKKRKVPPPTKRKPGKDSTK